MLCTLLENSPPTTAALSLVLSSILRYFTSEISGFGQWQIHSNNTFHLFCHQFGQFRVFVSISALRLTQLWSFPISRSSWLVPSFILSTDSVLWISFSSTLTVLGSADMILSIPTISDNNFVKGAFVLRAFQSSLLAVCQRRSIVPGRIMSCVRHICRGFTCSGSGKTWVWHLFAGWGRPGGEGIGLERPLAPSASSYCLRWFQMGLGLCSSVNEQTTPS